MRAAAESAARDGWAVSAVDLFGDVDTRRCALSWHPLPPAADFSELIQGLPPGPVVATGGVEQWHEGLERLRPIRRVLVPECREFETLRDPAFLQRTAARVDLAFPSWAPAGASGPPAGWLVKATRSSGGVGVLTSVGSPAGDAYFQERVAGRPFGAAFLADSHQTQLLGVTRSFTCARGTRPFLYAGSAGPVRCPPKLRARLLRLADALRDQVDLRGLFGVDLQIDASSATTWLLEVNPRITASMELLEPPAGPSLVSRHVAACGEPGATGQTWAEGRSNAAEPHGQAALCPRDVVGLKRIVWSRRPFQWNPLWIQATAGSPAVWLSDIPQPGTWIGSGEPVVTIRTTGPTLADCRRAAGEVTERLRVLMRRSHAGGGWTHSAGEAG